MHNSVNLPQFIDLVDFFVENYMYCWIPSDVSPASGKKRNSDQSKQSIPVKYHWGKSLIQFILIGYWITNEYNKPTIVSDGLIYLNLGSTKKRFNHGTANKVSAKHTLPKKKKKNVFPSFTAIRDIRLSIVDVFKTSLLENLLLLATMKLVFLIRECLWNHSELIVKYETISELWGLVCSWLISDKSFGWEWVFMILHEWFTALSYCTE